MLVDTRRVRQERKGDFVKYKNQRGKRGYVYIGEDKCFGYAFENIKHVGLILFVLDKPNDYSHTGLQSDTLLEYFSEDVTKRCYYVLEKEVTVREKVIL